MPPSILLSPAEWRAREQAHETRADGLTRGWRERAVAGVPHPVDDFMFTYYPFRPALLRRWHPGAAADLAEAIDEPRASWKWYLKRDRDVAVDVAGFFEAKRASLRFIASFLSRTAARPANFGCFGLHEWAMVYRQEENRHRVPLRLGPSGTDEVVETNRISCSHFDAYRFFTPEASGLNRLRPTRENQPELEQPGCLHAGMDVYKWAIKLGPLIPGELLLDAFEHARAIRELDMRASPYDLGDWGYSPVKIESPEGKAEYVRAQRDFAERSNRLRERLLQEIEPVLAAEPVNAPPEHAIA